MRKNCIRTLIAIVLIASTMTATAFAETALVTGSEVNVRSGPGANYAILGSYSRGDSVEVVDRSNSTWYAVNYEGLIGYMSSDYLSLQETSNYAIIVSDAAVQPAADTGQGVISAPAPVMQTNAQIAGMYVRFRSGPSSGSSILGEYNNGKAITVIGTEGEWSLCYIDGQYGYIYSQYVSSSVSAPAVTSAPVPASSTPAVVFQDSTTVPVTPAPIPPAPVTPVPAPAYGQSVLLDQPSGVIVTTPIPTSAPVLVTPTPAPATGSVALSGSPGVIVGDYVRFRRGPGTGYSIINSYDHGKEISVIAAEGDWMYCQIDGQNGYVYRQYVQTGAAPAAPAVQAGSQTVGNAAQAAPLPVSVTPAPAAAGGSTGYIRGNNVRFRSAPDLSSDIMYELFYGNAVTITGSDGTWTSLIHQGQAGYVFSQYVQTGTFQNVSTGGSATGREIADYALQYVGTPYHWGGVDPTTGFDCSGFAYYVYKHFGYTLNRVASEQALNGKHVDVADLQPGDLLCFYSGGSYIGHVGIYIGSNRFVHAATSTTGVITSELTGYYAQRGFEVRRIVS